MENKFNFNSSPCTNIEQSKRLLELGLRKETADCGHFYERGEDEEGYYWDTIILDGTWPSYWDVTNTAIPAWSLHRLIEMVDNECVIHLSNFSISGKVFTISNNLYDNICNCIEWLINAGYFNKEYLE